MAVGIPAVVRRGIEVMTAQGETPERIAAHYGIPVDAVKRPARKG